MPYRVLQHGSTLLGMALLTFWVWTWYAKRKNLPETQTFTNTWQAPRYLKKIALSIIIIVPIFIAIFSGMIDLPETDVMNGMYAKHKFLSNAIVGWAKAFIISTALMGLLYQYRIFLDKKAR
jgi:TRAP-type C4-dicarboxylate transport system permease large subunit